MIDCLSRNRPILGLRIKEELFGHAPEAEFIKLFPGSSLLNNKNDLEFRLKNLPFSNTDYREIYESNFSYSRIKQTYLGAVKNIRKLKHELKN